MGTARPWKRLFSSLARAGGPGQGRPSVELEVERWGELPLLRLSGELDHHAAGSVREALQKVLLDEEAQEAAGVERAQRGLIIDMDQLSYIDSGGLALLFDVARTFEDQGQGHFLGILNPNSHVLRLLDISGLRELPGVRMIVDGDDAALTTDDRSSNE